MLRTSLRSARALRGRSFAATASASAAFAPPWGAVGASQRFYADVPKPPVLPASETTTAASSPTPTPSSTAPQNVPLTPPAPPAASSSSTVAPPPPPPKPKRGFFRRLRNYVLTLSVLGALAFGGGVWYSRVNDNFHDFFTEYVPYGEQAVLHFEELNFRKRFPHLGNRVAKPRDATDDVHVRVPAQSGASWRVAHPDNSRQNGSAVKKAEVKPVEASPVVAESAAETAAVAAAPVAAAAEDAAPKRSKKSKKTAVPDSPVTREAEKAIIASTADIGATKAVPAAAAAAAPAAPAFRPPEVDEPSRFPPVSPIDPLAVKDAMEPVVQDVVHLLNDIITVVNADKASAKYGATIAKAKAEVNEVGRKVRAVRDAAEAAAAGQLQARTETFDAAARDLLARVEGAMAEQEAQWRHEFDEEMTRVRSSYEARVDLATARERQLSEEKLQNKLLEQAVQMTQQFADELRTRVEAERGGRLSRLDALSASVADLERLTAGWTDVVDASQRAQQLHVAIDAVRTRLSDDTTPVSGTATTLRPFVKELVAVKEIAGGDEVVDAAIAAIPPAAYQRGIATTPELIDRFRRVAAEVRKASLLPEDAGVASHASSYVLSKVLFRKTAAAGDADVESILTRTQAFLEEGNLDGAAREVNGLTGWAKTLSRDWLGEVRKVLEVQQALDVISTEARLRILQLEKSR